MSSPILNVPGGNNNPRSPFVPPSGGDLTLRSSDGVDFLVHSTFLKLGSSVFSDMMATGTTKDTVDLTEDSTGVSYLLRFIYPNRLPLTISPDELPVCLAVVQKYDLGGALEIIDELIVLDTLPHKLLSSDPLRAYQLAVEFNLVQTRLAAARLITPNHLDFCDPDKISELAQKYPPGQLIYLMNIQAMRAKLLSDVLFKFEKPPIQPPGSIHDLYWVLTCTSCRSHDAHMFNKAPPPWALAWLRLVYEVLLISPVPIEQWSSLFQSTFLKNLERRPDVCQTCISNIQTSPRAPVFHHWAQTIKEVLEAQVAKLELVYAL